MYHNTKGIVLNYFNYNDKSLIVKIYTELFGLQSYMVSRSRSKSARVKINLMQPLTLVDLIVFHKNKHPFQKIKELKLDLPFVSLHNNIIKNAIVLFLNEIIYKSIKEENEDPTLFNFIKNSLLYLDLKTENYNNFHLQFLLQFCKHLGFYPQVGLDNGTFFNLREGVFQANEPNHTDYLTKEVTSNLIALMNCAYDTDLNISITNSARRELIAGLIRYYQLHLTNIHEIKSHLVLEQVIS